MAEQRTFAGLAWNRKGKVTRRERFLAEQGLLLRRGRIVDATIIHAPSLTKNALSEYWKGINRSRSRVRARCEHGFLIVKRLWGFQKVRYRGLAKNTARAYTAFALANMYLLRKRLLPPGATYAL